MKIENFLNPDFSSFISIEFITSIFVLLIIIVFSFIVYFKQKKYDPIKDKPKGIISVAEYFIEKIDNNVKTNMGPGYNLWGGYFAVLTLYMMLSFVVGMMGIPNFIYIGENAKLNSSTLLSPLSNPFVSTAFPFSIGIVTFALIQFVSIRYKRWKYLKQFVAPIPIVGVFSLFSPLLSLSLRLFGNALAGFCISTITYQAFYSIGNGIGLVLVPVFMPFFHGYFDLFSGYIQTLVFTSLSMIDIAQEGPSFEEQIKCLNLKAGIEIPK